MTGTVFSVKTLGVAAAALVASFAFTADASAFKHKRAGQFAGQITGPKGGVHSFSRKFNRAPGQFEARRAYTGPRGGTRDIERRGAWGGGQGETGLFRERVYPDGTSRSFRQDRQWDREAGTAGLDRERTFRDGTSRTFERDRNWDREAGVYSRDQSRTYRDGSTTSSSRDIIRQDDGSFAVEGSFTNREGETRTYSGTVTPGGEE